MSSQHASINMHSSFFPFIICSLVLSLPSLIGAIDQTSLTASITHCRVVRVLILLFFLFILAAILIALLVLIFLLLLFMMQESLLLSHFSLDIANPVGENLHVTLESGQPNFSFLFQFLVPVC